MNRLIRMVTSPATIAAALAIVVTLWAHWIQPPLNLSSGEGWDGIHYAAMARLAAAGEGWPPSGDSYFEHRVGVPLLVGTIMRLTGAPLLLTFRWVNATLACIAALALYAWLGFFTRSPGVRFIGLLLFLIQWCGPVRYAAWYSTYVDPGWWAAWCCGLLGLEYIRQGRSSWVFLVSLAAALFCKEIGALLWLGTLDGVSSRRGVVLCLVSGCITAGILAYLGFGTVVHQKWTWTSEGWRMLLLSEAVAFGPMLVVLAGAPVTVLREIGDHPYQVPILAVMAAASGLSLGDALNGSVRLVYWSAPFVLAAIVTALDRLQLVRHRAWELIGSLVALQAIAARVFWSIPNEPQIGPPPPIVWLTPWGSTGPWGDPDVWWASESVRTTVAHQYTIVFGVLLFLLICYRLRGLSASFGSA